MPSPCQIKTSLPDGTLLVHSCLLRESISTLGEMTLSLHSEKRDIASDDLLGKPVTVSMAFNEERKRYLSGYVTRFSQGGFQGKHYVYEMTVRPWLWLLTRTADCRIFQDMSVPDIVKAVFHDHPVANFEFKLFRQYRNWIYCVQYRETDFNFIARLLEHEGIYWYVEHSDGQHKLVLTDSSSAHDAASGCEALPFYANVNQAPPQTECITRWKVSHGVKSGKVVMKDYDFERPSADLKVVQSCTRSYDLSDMEVFDFPGDYIQTGDGKQYAEDRLDEIQTAFETFSGSSNAQGICAGYLLEMRRHPRDDQNAKYLVTSSTLRMKQPVHESSSDGNLSFRCDFGAIVATQQFRPARRTPKPSLSGPQTAVVTGPAGEEIFTDKYGRVKVQFPWDRLGKNDEKSSCWVSVAHPWAGSNFGGIHIPRIGQEVIVGFLEGDPDRPIIIGRAYNAENMPPFELPAGAVVSGIKSKSHKATGYNELSMDDTAGKEKITIHGQYDMATTIEHDQACTVHNNRTDKIDVDDAETVGNNQTQTVGVNQTVSIGSNQDITVGANRTKTVGSNETLAVGANQAETIAATRTLSVGGADSQSYGNTQNVTVALMKAETIGAVYALSVGGAMNHAVGAALMQEVAGAKIVGVGAISSEKVGISKSISAGSNVTIEAGAKMAYKAGASYAASAGSTMSLQSGGDYSVSSSAKVGIDAASELVLKCGSAQLILKSGGDITLKGSGITIEGSGKIVVKASGELDLQGSSINENS